jgi:hypothetical protein
MPKQANRPPAPRASLFRLLDPPATAWRWGAGETITLALYCAVVAFGIHQHIPWADESQAWMLAHEVSLPTLLGHSLHYEGTPGLWHCLLKLLQLFHLSFTAARWIAGGIAAGGVAVLLAYGPFPRVVRLLLPFTFFLAYQDAVIARSYVLFAVFAFAAAALLRSLRPRPVLLALVLGGMANISLHALLASGALALVAAGRWRHGPGARRRRLLTASACLLVPLWIVAVATMAPARDVDFSAGNNVWRSLSRLENQLGIPAVAPPPISSLTMASLPRAPLPVHVRDGRESAWHKCARTLAVITYPLAAYRWLALLLFVLVAAQSRRPQTGQSGHALGPIGLLPHLALVLAFTSLYLEPRHAGMVFTCFVVAAWLTWPSRPALPGRRLLLERSTAAVFALVLALQIGWTGRALWRERTLPYSPDRMTAAYLQQNGVDAGPVQQAAGFYYYSVGPLLYFTHNIYFNQPPHRYWLWSTEMRSYSTVQQVLAQHPRFIVIGGYEAGPDAEITRDWLPNTPPEPGVRRGDFFSIGNYFRQHGYRETHLFCGHSWMRSSWAEQDCALVLEPVTGKS